MLFEPGEKLVVNVLVGIGDRICVLQSGPFDVITLVIQLVASAHS